MAFDVGGGGGKNRVRPSMNVTPLVDVVLVLLIIFMVITPLLTKQFYVHVPKKDEKAVEKAEEPDTDAPPPVVLTVLADGTIRINRDAVTKSELPERLTRIFAARTDNVLFFDAADDLSYGVAMEVLDTARSGGAASIAVLTEPAR